MKHAWTAWTLGLCLGACAETPETPEAPARTAAAQDPLIYGADDRLDRYEVGAAPLRALMDNTVAVMSASALTPSGGGWRIATSSTLATAQLVCLSEPYRDQPTTAYCTGFPVATDKIVTAGHCINATNCGSTRFVFGYHMLDANTANDTVGADDVYGCAEILERQETATADYAVVRLDRPLTGHDALDFRRSGSAPVGTALFVIGHPSGLPSKLAGGASVRANSNSAYFEANLDTYGGNSGSPVFNATTLQVEGILVRGNTDYVTVIEGGQQCRVSNVCPDGGCPGWEDATRTTLFAAGIAECGNGVLEAGEECDGAALGGVSCGDRGCSGGGVTCTPGCALDYGACTGCPACDFDGVCDAGEDCTGCEDCAGGATPGAVCGNGVCETANGEDCVSCAADCNGMQSGKASRRYCCGADVGCGDSRCGSCTDVPAVPQAYCCGDGACGGPEDCGTCALDCAAPAEICDSGRDDNCDGAVDCADAECAALPLCEAPPQSCGDGTCAPGEDCLSCPGDCAGVTGGKPSGRYCCGNGAQESRESAALCDGNF